MPEKDDISPVSGNDRRNDAHRGDEGEEKQDEGRKADGADSEGSRE